MGCVQKNTFSNILHAWGIKYVFQVGAKHVHTHAKNEASLEF